jgi:hypothetical protein
MNLFLLFLLMIRILRIRCDQRPVFQANNIPSIRTKTFTHFPDVKEALIASQKIKLLKDKREYFVSVGLDYDRTVQYYDLVNELNELFDKTKVEPVKADWLKVFRNIIH